MTDTLSPGRPTVLVIHDDGDVLDSLIRLFEASGFDVITAVTIYRAQAHLEGDRRFDVVVASWDTTHGIGGEVYRWTLQKRYDLRDQFVFVGSDPPSEFDRIVAGRCLSVSLRRPAEIVRVAWGAIRSHQTLEAMRDAAVAVDDFRPRLLLADDDPAMLMVIGDLLAESYAVTRVEGGQAAVDAIAHRDFEVIVADWQMDGTTGADLFAWVDANKPLLAQRIVFLSTSEVEDAEAVAPGRPMFRKGQDSHALISVLNEIVRQVRAESNPEIRVPEV